VSQTCAQLVRSQPTETLVLALPEGHHVGSTGLFAQQRLIAHAGATLYLTGHHKHATSGSCATTFNVTNLVSVREAK